METLILWSSTQALAGLARRRGDAAARATRDAFREDLLATGLAWQAIHTAADFNRRVVVALDVLDDRDKGSTADGDNNEALVARIEATGAGCEVSTSPGLAGLASAIAIEFDRGARAVAVIGLASPSLPTYLLDHAFRALQFERVVVGPTHDGGLWLIGAQRPVSSSLVALEPGTAGVLTASEEAFATAGEAPHLLPWWYSVDDDLGRLAWHLRQLRRDLPGHLPHTWDALLNLDASEASAGRADASHRRATSES